MAVVEAWKSDYLYWITPRINLKYVLKLASLLAPVAAIRLYAQLTCGIFKDESRMDGKTVVVTGANCGIGKETARELAKRGARVVMACRNVEAANSVKDKIIDSTKNTKVIVKKLDLSSFASIREFAEDIKKTEERLDVLIHNAGYAEPFKKKKSVDGIEMTMSTNFYGPFLLTHLLIDLLKKNAPSRIIVVASSLYRLVSYNLNNPNPLTILPAYLYFASKEANILFTMELARRLEGTGITVNCLHPGIVDTEIWRNIPAPLSWIVYIINKCFFKTSEQGCQTSVMLAVDEKLAKVSGKYFSDCQESSVSTSASDMNKAKKMWEICEKMVQLKDDDPKL
ncbi:Retinol dehydrogenase 14 [Eumeta japonica]|uniref:Retinol dehydrogenase 14 n=1 Tax=Eumeta variegata TaxID=151549 RepID=A0A4C1TZ66_EUMVA|nr:Retinol dehydrogenase 14 [Eumeta japonica]